LQLIKFQVWNGVQKDPIGETLVVLLAYMTQGESEQAAQQLF
jgi:hypothetical protein